MASRPNYKRAASSTSVPQIPSQRRRLESASLIHDDSSSSFRKSIIFASGAGSQNEKPFASSTSERRHQPLPSQLRAQEAGTLSEFPFPRQVRSRPEFPRLEISIPPFEIDIDAIDGTLATLQPRSNPERFDSFSSSCPSLECSSPFPSPINSTQLSPLSPVTPATPARIFTSATLSLQQIMMANEIDMSLEAIKELNEFANLQVTGSEKRAGRILVNRPIRQRRSIRRGSKDKKGASHGEGHEDNSENRDWWKEVNWSRFSDSSSASSSDSDEQDPISSQNNTMQAPERRQSSRGCIFLPSGYGTVSPSCGVQRSQT